MATRGWQHVQAIVSPAKPAQKRATMPRERRSKFGAVRTVVHSFAFASKREAAHYEELLQVGAAGYLRNLELQPRFPLSVNGQRVGAYVADFRYEELVCDFDPWWRDVVTDVKGMKTPVYRLKKKLVEAQYGIVIREIR